MVELVLVVGSLTFVCWYYGVPAFGWIALGALASIAWFFGVPISVWLVGRKLLFFSPKKGSMVAVVRNNDVIGYYGNIRDDRKYVKEKTGEVKNTFLELETTDRKGEKCICEYDDPVWEVMEKELEGNILYQWLGVYWLGMNDLLTYQFTKASEPGVTPVVKKVEAESIYLKNLRDDWVFTGLVSRDGVKVEFKVTVILETVNAALSLNYRDGAWMTKVKKAIESACREFCGQTTFEEIIQVKVEGENLSKVTPSKKEMDRLHDEAIKVAEEGNTTGVKLLSCVMALNTSDAGNPGLPDTVGQKILSFHVTEVFVDEKYRKLLLAQKEANVELIKVDQQAKAMVKKAEAEASSMTAKAVAEAGAVASVGKAKNDVLRETAGIVHPDRAADIEIAEEISNALRYTSLQALSFGGQGIPFILSGEKSKKEKKEDVEEKKE